LSDHVEHTLDERSPSHKKRSTPSHLIDSNEFFSFDECRLLGCCAVWLLLESTILIESWW
jgi:hypothetical protein